MNCEIHVYNIVSIAIIYVMILQKLIVQININMYQQMSL